MNWRVKTKIIDAICNDEILYIKNTGIPVKVEEFSHDEESIVRTTRITTNQLCSVILLKPANKKSLDLCTRYCISRNRVSNILEVTADIKIVNLSLTPFESRGSKLLYAKSKKNK